MFTGPLMPTVQPATVTFNGTRETTLVVGRRITIDQDGVITEEGSVGGYIYEPFERNLAGLGSVKFFHAKGNKDPHYPETTLTVPDGYKILGGGARVNWSEPGNL